MTIALCIRVMAISDVRTRRSNRSCIGFIWVNKTAYKRLVMTFYAEDLANCHHAAFADSRLPPAVLTMLREFGIEGCTVVDLGCNGGHLLVALTTAGFKAIGVDVSAPALALAAEKPRRKQNYTARISATLRLYLRTR